MSIYLLSKLSSLQDASTSPTWANSHLSLPPVPSVPLLHKGAARPLSSDNLCSTWCSKFVVCYTPLVARLGATKGAPCICFEGLSSLPCNWVRTRA